MKIKAIVTLDFGHVFEDSQELREDVRRRIFSAIDYEFLDHSLEVQLEHTRVAEEKLEHAARALLARLDPDEHMTSELREVIKRYYTERHAPGCVCADCSGAELTARND